MVYVIMAMILLGVLITLHEAGHLLTARLCGIPAEEFSVGMGPVLFSCTSRKSGTRYALRMFPLGGFCRFYGEDEDAGQNPRSFQLASVPKRAAVVFGGPFMNFLTAVLVIILYLSAAGIPSAIPVAGEVEENAYRCGLRIGDRIVSVNGERVSDAERIAQAIASSDGSMIEITVVRDGKEENLSVNPFFDEEAGRYRIGFSFAQQRRRISILESIPFSLRYNAENAGLIFGALRNLFSKGEGIQDLTGPVGTVYIIQEVTRSGGFDMYMELAALISVNLGVMNLLPFPGLDGSRLLFLLLEAIRRKPVRKELEGTVHLVGFVLLMGLMVALTYKDILQFFGK